MAETAHVLDRGLPSRSLPRRDAESLAVLTDTARRARPVVLARDRVLAVPGTLGALLPGSALRRGEVVTVQGDAGAGATSVALAFAAAATSVGEWAAAVGVELSGPRAPGDLGAQAALEAGVALERLAVVRRVPPARWATAVAALLDGVSLVLAEVPRYARAPPTPGGWWRAPANGARCWCRCAGRACRGPPTPRCGSGPTAGPGPVWRRATGCWPSAPCACTWRAGVRRAGPAPGATAAEAVAEPLAVAG